MSSGQSPPESTANTRLGRALEGAADSHPGQAGFLAVSDGIDALAIRLLLADRAERSIDTQYYEIGDDLAGLLFIEALLRAADRGVHVKLLVDDYQTTGYDARMAALDSHPNFEIRLYNPFARRRVRFVDVLTSFSRINRRMHNKSFTVDRQMTVIGGRNIADHYFSIGPDVNFADLDVVGIGPIVADVSTMFLKYWNSRDATPVHLLAKKTDDDNAQFARLLERVSRARAEVGETKYAEAVRSSILDKLDRDISDFTWAPYQLAYDSPEKTQGISTEDAASVLTLLTRAFENAKSEVLVVSPYFVPRRSGLGKFRGLRDRGIDVTVVTNSLASNNQTYAHGGYAPVRKPLLRMGVRLFELRADASVAGNEPVGPDPTRATLHTKAFAIDRTKLFVGSFNFDPRSANLNTEMGVIIDSPELAQAFVRGAQRATPRETYEVILGINGALRWRGLEDNVGVMLDKEPQAGFWRRVAGGVARWLPIRGQV